MTSRPAHRSAVPLTSSQAAPRRNRLAGLGLASLLVLGTCGLLPQTAMAKRLALLVGVSHYDKLPQSRLEGPVHDVAALRDVLQRRWGYAPADVVTLVDRQASRAAILRELAALQQRSQPGDEVLIYFSGHGTSALDTQNQLPVPHGSGAFMPADLDPTRGGDMGLLIGRTHLRPALQALDDGGRKVWVISDSCYAGQQVRSVATESTALPARMVPLLAGQALQELDQAQKLGADAQTPEPYPYQSVAYLAASAEGETARDIPAKALHQMPTRDGKPHGALTDALLRVLEGELPADADGDGLLSLAEVHRGVSDFMSQRAYGHSPQRLPAVVDDRRALGQRAVLTQRGMAAPVRANAARQPLRVHLWPSLKPRQSELGGVPDLQMGVPPTEADLVLRPALGGKVVLSARSGDVLAVAEPDGLADLRGTLLQLSYAKRLHAWAQAHRRAVLPAEIEPATFGGNFVDGQSLRFALRPDRAATLLLLNIDATGRVSVLYPAHAGEMQPLAAGDLRRIPGEGPTQALKVQAPYGMDVQHLFAFDSPPAGLDRLVNAQGLAPDDARLAALERTLQQMHGAFSHASTELRTHPRPAERKP
ncbi:caspase family protein [Sphaerotilus mobilis]|uniref:Uncharacterized protein DUF4384 n=1 Tax=Sphaerotilus mobilis TaxID=47994 RepID=A0A4Q7LQX7_9BURK|nr:caspase family protein [Sphaerotilus mobilis]RZS57114.1 uncharacterized protein DUF4384 [Sphaerotilus mobilis]